MTFRRGMIAAALLAALLGVRTRAHAGQKTKPLPKRVAVLPSGPHAGACLEAVKRALQGFTVVRVPENGLQQEAARWGVPLGTDAAYQGLALAMKANAVIRLSTFDRPDGSASAVVQLRDGATGAVIEDATWRAKNGKSLASTLTREVRPRLGTSLAGTRVPPPGTRPRPPPGAELAGPAAATAAAAPGATVAGASAAAASATPGPVAVPPGAVPSPLPSTPVSGEAEPVPSPASAGPTGPGPRRVVLDLAVGGGIFSRSLTYKDDLFASLSGYSLGVSANLALALQWYPLAAGESFLGNVGVVGAFDIVPGLSSTSADGTSFPTAAYAWEAGLRVRFPFAQVSEVGLSAVYQAQVFRISSTPTVPRPNIPDVSYRVIALGVDARFGLGQTFSILLHAGYGFVLSAGEITGSTYFPRASVGCVEGGLGVGIAFSPLLELRLLGDIRRYFYSFHPVPGDPYVAGGAVDQYLTGTAVLAFRF